MANLETRMCEGVVDEDIVSLLELLNSFEDIYTLSSCSGRIALIELPELGDKRGAVFHGKWHKQISFEEAMTGAGSFLENGSPGTYLYLLTQCPILHINIRDRELAETIFQRARNCGFKNSAFKSIASPFLLEILSTERVDIPLGYDGDILVGDDALRFFVERCNHALRRGKKKLEKLENELRGIRQNKRQ